MTFRFSCFTKAAALDLCFHAEVLIVPGRQSWSWNITVFSEIMVVTVPSLQGLEGLKGPRGDVGEPGEKVLVVYSSISFQCQMSFKCVFLTTLIFHILFPTGFDWFIWTSWPSWTSSELSFSVTSSHCTSCVVTVILTGLRL